MVLDVLICTYNEGINELPSLLLETIENVHYTISHQYTDDVYLKIPKSLKERNDVLLIHIPGKGLCKNRNNALSYACGDIALIADDDVKYTYEYFNTIINVYKNNDVDVACFMIFTGDGQPFYKNYPTRKMIINSIRDYTPSSIEITFKLNSIKSKNIYFDERFGLGSKFQGGEETIFIHDCITKGLKVAFFPDYIVNHPFESTSKSLSKYHSTRTRVTGAIDARVNSWKSIPKAFFGTIKLLPDLLKSKKNPIIYFLQRISASFYILFTKSK